MAATEIIFSPDAERELKQLCRKQSLKLIQSLELWSKGQQKLETEKIKSQPNFFRLRVGDLRVIYYPLNAERIVVLLIRDRKDSYKNLASLPAKLVTASRHLNIATR